MVHKELKDNSVWMLLWIAGLDHILGTRHKLIIHNKFYDEWVYDKLLIYVQFSTYLLWEKKSNNILIPIIFVTVLLTFQFKPKKYSTIIAKKKLFTLEAVTSISHKKLLFIIPKTYLGPCQISRLELFSNNGTISKKKLHHRRLIGL